MVIVYFMDGVKYDMMKQHMPFLSTLNHKPLKSEFGYSCACHATMYTGKYIDEHNTWFIWKKGENSPYKWINYIPGLKYLNFLPIKLIIAKITRKLSNNSSYAGVSCLVNLPLKYWSYFELCDKVMWNDPNWKKNIPNLFSILKEKNISNQSIALHRNTKANDIFEEEKKVDYTNNSFLYFFAGYTDNMMHSYGEDGIEVQKYFKDVDNFVKKTYEKAKKYNEDVTIVAFSDHGHIDVEKEKININDYFKIYNSNVNKFIHLIESNFARFWFRNDEEKKLITKILNQMEKEKLGFILKKEHFIEYHLEFKNNEHGDLIFYLNAPNIFTNTIWGFGNRIKSSHGYDPNIPKNYGFFCSNKPLNINDNFVYLTDILPTILNQLNIVESDYEFHGTNIIKKVIGVKKSDKL